MRHVIEEMTATLPRLNLADQFIGFCGSSGPSQLTTFGSRSACSVVSISILLEEELRLSSPSRSISLSSHELAGGVCLLATECIASGAEDVSASGRVDMVVSGSDDCRTSAAVTGAVSGNVDGGITGAVGG